MNGMRDVWIRRQQFDLFAREDGEGPALVFLHGGLADHRAVLPIVGALADRYRVIVPDLRGSGRSQFSGALSFDGFASDLAALLDELDVPRAFIGGISSGSGPAVRFALKFPERTLGLIVAHPVYGGSDRGYTAGQTEAFNAMDAVAGRTVTEGIQALKPLYLQRLPEGVGDRAWRIAAEFDPGSVAATSRFIASGAQPFDSAEELASISVPSLVIAGSDDVHPPEMGRIGPLRPVPRPLHGRAAGRRGPGAGHPSFLRWAGSSLGRRAIGGTSGG